MASVSEFLAFQLVLRWTVARTHQRTQPVTLASLSYLPLGLLAQCSPLAITSPNSLSLPSVQVSIGF